MHTAAEIKGDIDTMPEIIGLIVHLPGHVGVYIGGGWVIEARGFNHGVVLTRLKDRPWTSWFKCPYIEYIDDAAYEESPLGNEAAPHDLLRTLSYSKGSSMMRGADVAQAQELLNSMGFEAGSVDGIYGPKTVTAVRAFQKDAELPVSGIVDEQTWDALLAVHELDEALDPSEYDTEIDVEETNPEDQQGDGVEQSDALRLLKYNTGSPMMRGEDVRAIQQTLSDRVFGLGDVDGVYGPKTEAAVKAFQKSMGIRVDGIVGPETLAHLLGGQQDYMKQQGRE